MSAWSIFLVNILREVEILYDSHLLRVSERLPACPGPNGKFK